ncbi:hypothetical protein AMATHDRAFT_141012 [Amanita thiersii Skay4041]|uniref:AAA+ ATPase domain-containing protein n=1 Tax=Amanita thiersii Skay4041 TaxID=703135 RepID=A0A2A9NPP6_9AGAR|nr:hypothetical protein AMATHDRAFT_141012 [Amanita thiersii Skay4041]
MQTSRVTRSSVLGKRSHQQPDALNVSSLSCDTQLPTPESTPILKRARTALYDLDHDANKENVPPLSTECTSTESSPASARATRVLRRTATETSTPSRSRSVKRHASTSIIQPAYLPIITPPSTPKALLPLHARARTLLRATSNDSGSKVTCRDAERDVITTFLRSFINAESSQRCLYISGTPGTGKTALLNCVAQQFTSECCKVISLNCMALKNLDTFWERLFEELMALQSIPNNDAPRKLKGRNLVQTAITCLPNKCILVLDEMDYMASDLRSLESIFTLPQINPNMLCLIGIANTHTLTSSTGNAMTLVSDILTLHFAPYSASQLQEILQCRLDVLSQVSNVDISSLLPKPSLTLLAKKIATTTGDVRSLFEILRGAIDLAVTSSNQGENPMETSPKVMPSHILQALKAHSPSGNKSMLSQGRISNNSAPCNSEIVTKIDCLNLQARVALLCILLASKRLESGLVLSTMMSPSPKKSSLKRASSSTCSRRACIDTAQLHSYYSAALVRSDAACLNVVSKSEFGDVLVILEGSGLISLSGSSSVTSPSRLGRKMLGRSVSFSGGLNSRLATSEIRLAEGVWVDEVLRGLGIADDVLGDVLRSEVRGIWDREVARLDRDIKALTSSNNLD